MWGTASVKRLCRRARKLGYDRLALTDRNNLYGLWPFLEACRREGLTPIVGAEITDPGKPASGGAVCLVADDTGYANLCRLITRRHRQKKGFHLQTAVGKYHPGLVVLTAEPAHLTAWHRVGVHVAAALPARPLPPGHLLRRTARQLKIPQVAVPDSFFLDPEEYGIHRLLRAIDKNTDLSRLPPQKLAPKNAWLAGPAEYRRRFVSCPDAIQATQTLADELTFSGPDFGLVMPPWQDKTGRSAEERLRLKAYAGARKRYGNGLSEAVVERLEQELGIIGRMNFAAYFLVVADIVSSSPRTCGRGSGAASLVAYCLGITNVCPIKHNLYFGRFLNPGRSDPPDIDVDFAWDERDQVLGGVLDRFRDYAAMVSSHVLFQPRMAVRETAKVFGLTDGEIGQVSKRLPWFWRSSELDRGLLGSLKSRPETKHLDFLHPWPEVLALAQELIGKPRYLSVHPGGVVITPRPIDTYVPIERAPKGVPLIQWEKESVEEAGLVKIDLLGNRSLGVIRDAMANMRANGIVLDERTWEPEDDFDTQQALSQGQTMGCFYIESPAMRLLQQKSAVGDFEHLVIHSSIIRPAANEFIQEYLRRLHGGAWNPIHPFLADVLDETFGIMVYQEDVSRAAVALAGFSHTEADGLRKILSKKEKEHQMRDYHGRFVAGARRKGVLLEQIKAVWAMMMSFSGYSFCKPHSASYARVSFQAAYLKVHHPAEFMAAVISNQGGFYATFAYVSEARRMGLTILPPDLMRSAERWHGGGSCLRVGLMAVSGLSSRTMARIISVRKARPYDSLTDFLDRVHPDEAEATNLIHCGAADGLHPEGHRGALLWELSSWRRGRQNRPVQANLFEESRTPQILPPHLPPEDPLHRLRREFKVLGFLCACHPMVLFEKRIRKCGIVKVAHLPRFMNKMVRLAAWLVTGKVVHTKQGNPMEFLTFEDETGIVETTFFPKTYRRFCHMIDRNRPYLLSGRVEQNWGALTLTVASAKPL
jgi:DNA polymerase-3 subunit alpha/error-prone DNA polymerase